MAAANRPINSFLKINSPLFHYEMRQWLYLYNTIKKIKFYELNNMDNINKY